MTFELVDALPLLLLAPFLALEFAWPARRYAAPPGWRLRALAISAAVFGVSFVVGRAWGAFLPAWSLVDGAALAGGFLAFNAAFQHANVKTPHWLGYLIQRPESHSLHHERGVHRDNYADLPLIDMLFGSFENPRRFEHATGFWDGASARVVDMLLARDVSRPTSTQP